MSFFKRELLVLLALFVAVLGVCVYHFTTNPASWFDEGIYQQVVHNMAFAGRAGLQLSPGEYSEFSLISVGYSVFYPAVVAMRVFGDSIVLLRLVAVIFLFIFVGAFYALAKRLYGSRLALWSMALLVTFSPLYGNGKNFLGEGPGLAYFALGLCLLYSSLAIGKKSLFKSLGAGLLLGLAVSAKPIYLLIIPAIGITYLWQYKIHLVDRVGRLRTALVAIGMVVAVAVWIVTQFGFSTSPTRILNHYRNPNVVGDAGLQVKQNLRRFVTESTPLHFTLLLVVAVAYVVLSIRKKRKLSGVEMIVFLFSVLVFISYVRTAGWYRYLFPGQVLLLLFFPVGLQAVAELWPRYQVIGQRLAVAFCALVLAAQLFPMYQERFGGGSDAPTAFEPFLQAIAPTSTVFFYNLPQIAARFQQANYWQFVFINPHISYGQENIPKISVGFFDYLFIPRSVLNEGQLVRVPACYEIRDEIKGIIFYQKNSALVCGSETQSGFIF